jgi:hypothetical protein
MAQDDEDEPALGESHHGHVEEIRRVQCAALETLVGHCSSTLTELWIDSGGTPVGAVVSWPPVSVPPLQHHRELGLSGTSLDYESFGPWLAALPCIELIDARPVTLPMENSMRLADIFAAVRNHPNTITLEGYVESYEADPYTDRTKFGCISNKEIGPTADYTARKLSLGKYICGQGEWDETLSDCFT